MVRWAEHSGGLGIAHTYARRGIAIDWFPHDGDDLAHRRTFAIPAEEIESCNGIRNQNSRMILKPASGKVNPVLMRAPIPA